MDIEPKGFQFIAVNESQGPETAEQVKRVIHDAEFRQQMVDHNFELGRVFFSYSLLRHKLQSLIFNITGFDL